MYWYVDIFLEDKLGDGNGWKSCPENAVIHLPTKTNFTVFEGQDVSMDCLAVIERCRWVRWPSCGSYSKSNVRNFGFWKLSDVSKILRIVRPFQILRLSRISNNPRFSQKFEILQDQRICERFFLRIYITCCVTICNFCRF